MDLSGYFDYASATPLDSKVVRAMEPYWSEKFYNPSAIYNNALEVKQDIKSARHDIAKILGVKPTEIIFTAGGTEASNLAIKGIMGQFDATKKVIISAIEHDSVLKPARNYNNSIIGVDEQGFIDFDELERKIDDDTVLVSIILANNEIGTIQDIKRVSRIVQNVKLDRLKRAIKTPIYIHTDACQAVNYMDVYPNDLGVDLMTINGGKIYGPKQSAVLYIKTGVKLEPLVEGGGQERGFRSGTESTANIIGLNKALTIADKKRKSETERVIKLKDQLINWLGAQDNVKINGPIHHNRIANNINFTATGHDNEILLMQLDEMGFQVATGSACSASNEEPSHVLKAIGLDEVDIRSSIRLSLGRHTSQASVDKLLKALQFLLAK